MNKGNKGLKLLAKIAKERLNGKTTTNEQTVEQGFSRADINKRNLRKQARDLILSEPDTLTPIATLINKDLFDSLPKQLKQKYFFDIIEVYNEEKKKIEQEKRKKALVS